MNNRKFFTTIIKIITIIIVFIAFSSYIYHRFVKAKINSPISFNQKNEKPYPLIFIVGAPRSGTTLLHGMIAKDYMIPECSYITERLNYALNIESHEKHPDRIPGRIMVYFGDKQNMYAMISTAINDMLLSAENYIKQKNRISKIDYLALKDPELTRHINYLPNFFGNNFKVISIVRDPRDVIASYKVVASKYNRVFLIDSVIQDFYSNYYKPVIDNNLPKNKIKIVRYEDIVIKETKTLSVIEDYLNISLDKSGISKDYVKTLSVLKDPWYVDNYDKVINDSSVGKYKEILTIDEIAKIETHFKDVMIRYNYKTQDHKA